MNYEKLRQVLDGKKLPFSEIEKRTELKERSLRNNFAKKNMSVETLEIICKTAGISPSDFLDNALPSSLNIQINESGDNHISLSECEKENKHLREIIAMKDKIISLLENK